GVLLPPAFLVVVGDARAVIHAAFAVHSLGAEQHGVCQRGFAAGAVPSQGDVAEVFGLVCHDVSLRCVPMLDEGQAARARVSAAARSNGFSYKARPTMPPASPSPFKARRCARLETPPEAYTGSRVASFKSS